MQIVNWSDLSWWQARKVNSKERPGLVPSQDLEERRQCFVQQNGFVRQASCCGTGVSNIICKKKVFFVLGNHPSFPGFAAISFEFALFSFTAIHFVLCTCTIVRYYILFFEQLLQYRTNLRVNLLEKKRLNCLHYL